MKLEDGKLILETRNCVWCLGAKLVAGTKSCTTCRGTGNGKRGGIGKCQGCYGSRTAPDFVNKVPCTACGASGIVPETVYDFAPDSIWQSFQFMVYRENRNLTWGESYLAIGNVFSCTDYGVAFAATDDSKVIGDVRKSHGHQACKFVKDDGTVADHIGICLTKSGYTVTAVYLKKAAIVEPKELVS